MGRHKSVSHAKTLKIPFGDGFAVTPDGLTIKETQNNWRCNMKKQQSRQMNSLSKRLSPPKRVDTRGAIRSKLRKLVSTDLPNFELTDIQKFDQKSRDNVIQNYKTITCDGTLGRYGGPATHMALTKLGPSKHVTIQTPGSKSNP